jgi:hypothetical protein
MISTALTFTGYFLPLSARDSKRNHKLKNTFQTRPRKSAEAPDKVLKKGAGILTAVLDGGGGRGGGEEEEEAGGDGGEDEDDALLARHGDPWTLSLCSWFACGGVGGLVCEGERFFGVGFIKESRGSVVEKKSSCEFGVFDGFLLAFLTLGICRFWMRIGRWPGH